MELGSEIDKMKKLTEITNQIEVVKSDLELLIFKRQIIMNEYLEESLISNLKKNNDD